MTPSEGDAGIATTTNAVIVRRLMEDIWGRGRWDLVSELIADTYVGHFAAGDYYGPEGVRIEIHAYRRAIPDLRVSLDDLFACDDKVVRRFTLRGTYARPNIDMRPGGHPLVICAIAIDHLVQGKLVESWIQIDTLPEIGQTAQHESGE